MFSTKINSFIYRNHSYLYSPFNVEVNVYRYHRIYEYVTSQLIPTTISSQGQPCSYKPCAAKPLSGQDSVGSASAFYSRHPGDPKRGRHWRSLCAPGRGLEGRGGAGLWGAGMGRAARVQRGRPGSVPRLSAVSLRTTPWGSWEPEGRPY